MSIAFILILIGAAALYALSTSVFIQFFAVTMSFHGRANIPLLIIFVFMILGAASLLIGFAITIAMLLYPSLMEFWNDSPAIFIAIAVLPAMAIGYARFLVTHGAGDIWDRSQDRVKTWRPKYRNAMLIAVAFAPVIVGWGLSLGNEHRVKIYDLVVKYGAVTPKI